MHPQIIAYRLVITNCSALSDSKTNHQNVSKHINDTRNDLFVQNVGLSWIEWDWV